MTGILIRPAVLLFAICVIAAAAASGQTARVKPTPTPEDDGPVRIVTEEVKVNVLAFDENGKFVSDVKEQDLVITENDILHQASSVRRIPANVLIIMDTGGQMRQVKSLDQTRSVAAALVAALDPNDSIAIIQYADSADVVMEWTTDRRQLLTAINKTKFGLRSAFVDALRLGTGLLAKTPSDNRHMILITDGTDDMNGDPARSAAMRDILSTDINVHVISYTALEIRDIDPRARLLSKTPPPKAMPDEIAATLPNGARDAATAPKMGPVINVDQKHLKTIRARKADLEDSQEDLDRLTRDTNGTFILPTSKEEMVEKTAAVARIIDSSYVLTYTPKIPLVENSEERNIVVTSKRPGLVVEAQRKLVVREVSEIP